jgi:trans-2,3-dihydro-3-hydroxyanthranilate isomerase
LPDLDNLTLDYFVMDVFTDTALKGNQLAVVMNTSGLVTDQMQAIAREFNLSETTFVERRAPDVERAQGVRVRIFTSQEELDFAGHPTLGTAAVLGMSAPSALQDDTVTLRLNVGPVPVKFSADGAFGEMTQPDPTFGDTLDSVEVAELIGLDVADLDPDLSPAVVSTGSAFAIVALASAASLGRLSVHQQEAAKWLRAHGARWFYVLAPTGATEPDYRARMQFNGGEDPATGSAAGCAIAYLVRHGVVAPGRRIHLRQGVEIARQSELFLSAEMHAGRVTGVRVAGSTVLVAKGQLFLR